MIDSGSAGNFISREAAKRLGMAKLPYSSDVNVRLADGSKLPLNWRTPQFQLKMGDHQEEAASAWVTTSGPRNHPWEALAQEVEPSHRLESRCA